MTSHTDAAGPAGARPAAASRVEAPASAVAGDRGRVVVMRVAVGLLLVQGLVRGWVCLRGWFYLDDLAFTGRAMEFRLWDPAYLGHTYNSHVMMGAWVWVWLTTHAFPMQWVPVAAVILLLQLCLGILVLRLLLALFGAQPLILPALAVALLAPLTLPASLWWAAAVNQLPMQLALVGGLLSLVRYLRTGSRRAAAAGPLALAGGLLFSEKTLFLVPLVVAVTLAYFTDGPTLWQRARRALVRDRLVWAGYALVSLPYAAYYVLIVPSPIRQTAMVGHELLDLAMTSVFRATLPGLVGGPLTWTPVGFAGALADPTPPVVAIALLLTTGVVALTVALKRRAGWAWAILGGYLVLNLLLLSRSRATVIGTVIGTEYRYQTDAAVVAAVMLGLATMSVTGRLRRGDPQPLLERPAARAALDERVITPLREAGALPPGPPSTVVALVAAATVATASVASTVAYDGYWASNPAKPWFATVRAELGGLPDGTRLADSFVPQDVAWGLIHPYNESFRVLAPVLDGRQALTPGRMASQVVLPDDAGHLRLAVPTGTRAQAGPGTACGWRIGTRTTRVPIPTAEARPATLVRIGYIVSASTTLEVTAGGRTASMPVARGLGAAYVQVAGPVDSVALRVTAAGVPLCTDDVTAGAATAIPGTAP